MSNAVVNKSTRDGRGTNELEKLKQNTQDQLNRLVQQVSRIVIVKIHSMSPKKNYYLDKRKSIWKEETV